MIKDDRIAELENENALLKRELMHIREPWRRYLYASGPELQSLVAIVKAAHPQLVPANLDTAAFATCFAFVATLGRVSEPDHRHDLGHWGNLCAAWANRNGANAHILSTTVYLAAVAHGDVSFTLADSFSGVAPELGLVENAGRPASHRWRLILAGTARLLPPTAPRPSQMAPRRSDILITGGSRHVGAGPSW